MDDVQVEQKSYEMPPKEGISVAHFLTVADVDGPCSSTRPSSEVER